MIFHLNMKAILKIDFTHLKKFNKSVSLHLIKTQSIDFFLLERLSMDFTWKVWSERLLVLS